MAVNATSVSREPCAGCEFFLWSTFSFSQQYQQVKGIFSPSTPIFSIIYLCLANTQVCLQFELSKLAIKINDHTCGQNIPLGSVEVYYPATCTQPKQQPYELCICCIFNLAPYTKSAKNKIHIHLYSYLYYTFVFLYIYKSQNIIHMELTLVKLWLV